MHLEDHFTCTFLGFGLIGGSIAKAMRSQYPNCKLYAYNRHPERILPAKLDGTLTDICNSLTDRIAESDLLFLCAPVTTNIENLKSIVPCLRKDTLITDVGSVKGNIHTAIQEFGLDAQFIGGHPMCGSEKTGYENAKENLLENSYYILTPTSTVNPQWVDAYFQLVKSLSAIPIVTNAKQHDYSTAAVSHVPHLIAGELVRLIMKEDSQDAFMKTIAAGGFKDITRIASSSPEMWQSICESNPENICTLLSKYIAGLSHLKTALEEGNFDEIGQLFAEAGPYRQSMNDLSGSTIQKIYQIYFDLPDKKGAIAQIAALLAENDINIKNIGITHNREHQEGVLYIVFYDEASRQAAFEVLHKIGNPILV